MIHLEVAVANTAELLAAQAYGAGALLRWESCAAQAGTYTEGGTAALVSGSSLYDVWDPAGTAATWYRTRISNAAGSAFSEYGAPFQSASADDLLSVDQFREHLVTRLPDGALQGLLNAARDAITERAGPIGTVTDVRRGGGGIVSLSRRLGSMASVVEQWLPGAAPGDVADAVYAAAFWQSSTALDPADYLVAADGRTVQRLATGPNPAEAWGQGVRLEYAAFDDTAERARVQIALVRLDIAHSPGLAAQSVLGAQEQYAPGTYAQQREDILSTLPGRRRWGFA